MKQRLKPSPDSSNDLRREALRTWLATQLPGQTFTLAPASADASFRRYFRVTLDGVTRIAMDAPPEREDSRPFIHVAQLMRDAGVHQVAVQPIRPTREVVDQFSREIMPHFA